MREVIILSGISGSGKSTYADEFCRTKYEGKYVCRVSADDYFMVAGSYNFDPEKVGQGTRAMLAQLHRGAFRLSSSDRWR